MCVISSGWACKSNFVLAMAGIVEAVVFGLIMSYGTVQLNEIILVIDQQMANASSGRQ